MKRKFTLVFNCIFICTVLTASLIFTACTNKNYVDKKIEENQENITVMIYEDDLPTLSDFSGVKIIRNELPLKLDTKINIVVAADEWFTETRISKIKALGYTILLCGNNENNIKNIAATYGTFPASFNNVAATLDGAILFSDKGQAGFTYLASVCMEKSSDKEKLLNKIKIGIYFCLNDYKFVAE